MVRGLSPTSPLSQPQTSRGFAINCDVPETPSYTLLPGREITTERDYGFLYEYTYQDYQYRAMHSAPAIHSACNHTHRVLYGFPAPSCT